MKKLLVFVLSIIFIMGTVVAIPTAAIKVPRAKIKIDGKVKDWKKIKKYKITKGTLGQKLDYKWWCQLAHNKKDTIYLRAQVTYPKGMGGPYASRPKNSPTWYEDDVIEFWVMEKKPTSERSFQEATRNTHYGWNSKVNFHAEAAGGLKVTRATKTRWIKSKDGTFGIEAAIKVKTAKMKRAIKNGRSLYLTVGYESRSGGAEYSLLKNGGGAGALFWVNYDAVQKATFSKKLVK